MNLIDLHIHSNFSDGVLSPVEIIEQAKQNGVSTIAIADHDGVIAYNEGLFALAKANNIRLIPAVEMSTRWRGIGIHVLGYNFDLHNSKLLECLNSLRNARHTYLFDVAKALNNLGYYVNVDELDKVESVTKAHISQDIIQNDKNRELLLKTFGEIPSRGEFIETLMNEGCPAFVEKKSVTPKQASDLIKQAGGKVVLAHPVAYTYEDGLTETDIQQIIDEISPCGIEGNYIYIDRHGDIINECEKWNTLAKQNKIISTIGSDFHLADDKHPVIGLSNTDLRLNNEQVENIINTLTH